jgi:WD40 repeat protein
MLVGVTGRKWLRGNLVAAVAVALASGGCGRDTPAETEPLTCHCLAFSLDGKLLAVGRGAYANPSGGKGSGDVVVWPTDTWANPRVFRNDLTSDVEGIAFAGEGREIIAAGNAYLRNVPGTAPRWDGKRIYSWVVASGNPKESIVLRDNRSDDFMKYAGFVSQMAYSPKLDLVGLALSGDRPLAIDLKTRKPKYLLEGHTHNGICLAFSPDGKTLASCQYQVATQPRRPLILVAADTGKFLREADVGFHACRLAFSPEGDRLAIGGMGGEVCFVTSDFKKSSEKVSISDHPVTAIAYSPTGDVVAVAAGRYNVEGMAVFTSSTRNRGKSLGRWKRN